MLISTTQLCLPAARYALASSCLVPARRQTAFLADVDAFLAESRESCSSSVRCLAPSSLACKQYLRAFSFLSWLLLGQLWGCGTSLGCR